MTNYPLTEQIACVRRELAMRKNVYPKWVQSGRMKQTEAERELGCMQAVHDTLQTVHDSLTKMQEKLQRPGLSLDEAVSALRGNHRE